MCERGEWRKQLRDFIALSLKQYPLGSGTACSLEDETEMVQEMQIEILNGGEILVNCKFKLNKNLNLNVYRNIPRNSNPIKISIGLCTVIHREI